MVGMDVVGTCGDIVKIDRDRVLVTEVAANAALGNVSALQGASEMRVRGVGIVNLASSGEIDPVVDDVTGLLDEAWPQAIAVRVP